MNDEIIEEIKRRILTLIADNPCLAIVQIQLETAALIGATVALELKDREDAAAAKFGDGDQPVKIGSIWV